LESGTQYAQVIGKLQAANPGLCILGLTATPYRLGLGWVYQYHQPRRALRTEEERFFKICIFELTLSSMIKQGFLTPPIRIDAPVACYDFSKLKLSGRQGSFSL
ncbi:MAG: ATP-dependent helicase, partial [Oligoflexus sp.]